MENRYRCEILDSETQYFILTQAITTSHKNRGIQNCIKTFLSAIKTKP